MESLNSYKNIIAVLALLILSGNVVSQNTPEHDLIVSVERIWDRAAHNAFTSLVEFNDRFYCSFRESEDHVSEINGSIRVIASDDGQNWYSVAHISERGVDLRDPQLSVTPDNRIMLNMGGSIYTNGKLEGMEPRVSFSDKAGKNFSAPQKITVDERIRSGKDWLWRATWHHGTSYATIYQPHSDETQVHLVESNDGLHYQFMTTFDVINGNETTLRFDPDDRMIAVVRSKGNGYIGNSEYPYKTWEWNELESRLGGPDLICCENGTMLCATREYLPDRSTRTIIARVDTDGSFTKLLTLPSGGDCSYPGLVMRDSILHVSYYSSHEEKTAVYMARIADLKHAYNSFDRVPCPVLISDQNGIVELSCEDEQAVIKYTLDGSIPSTLNGFIYDEPIEIIKTSLLRAVAIKSKVPDSKTLTKYVGTYIYQKPQITGKDLLSGLKYEYYEGIVKSTGEIRQLIKIGTGLTSTITAATGNRDSNYALIHSGYIQIPEDGTYTFYLTSNDGSRLYLNDELALDNDGPHGKEEESVTLSLGKGTHKFQLSYFQLGGNRALVLEWEGENFGRGEIPASAFFH